LIVRRSPGTGKNSRNQSVASAIQSSNERRMLASPCQT
jgi:hypothetical protein